MKILVDDMRTKLPDGSEPDIILRNHDAGLIFLTGWKLDSEHDTLYIDHDLGGEKTGYDLLTFFETLRHISSDQTSLPYDIICVSDNGPGRARINQVIQKLYGG